MIPLLINMHAGVHQGHNILNDNYNHSSQVSQCTVPMAHQTLP